ncbi:P-loop containing nucleoside triphosphate hydrolase protein [Cristinia sonorae]|uniref:P-loop containing nucleoside triphosphate hydrolase protein n=1 Tax=Cristinia sonorae TaxID=1940300 RepID=A0A8K0UWU7_9AGAR|nr:P-loop containing nucleoside triphosphate hydrolase protein [Cristinia sonorae]
MAFLARLTQRLFHPHTDGHDLTTNLDDPINLPNLPRMPTPILELKHVGCSKAKGQPIFTNVNFTVNEGDVVIFQGKSGSGKSTLLKCLAHLNLYEGEILYRGSTPVSHGIPSFRTRVLYVPQRPSLLPGTPRDFINTVLSFKSLDPKNKGNEHNPTGPFDPYTEPIAIGKEWGVDEELWDRTWTNLSGGEAQRIALAIAVGIRSADILLLDEPTSALDADSSIRVERFLTDAVRAKDGGLSALVWITHSAEQGGRVGTRFLRIAGGCVQEERPDLGV